jgi:hypothetical protein
MANKPDEKIKTPEERAKKNIETTHDNIDKLEETMVNSDENGLFQNAKKPSAFSEILDKVAIACQELDNEKNPVQERDVKGWLKYRAAYYQFNETLNSATSWWRFKFLYGGPFMIYFAATIVAAFFVWAFFNAQIYNIEIFWVPSYAFLWGIVGSGLQGLWFLWQHVNARKIRKVWATWYLFLPLIGMLLGAITYLVFIAGFFTTSGNAQIQSKYFIMLLCALAGFSSRWAVETLDKITNLIKIG